MTENWGAEQYVTLLLSEENSNEHTKNVQGEVRRIDTSLLMGDPKSFFSSRTVNQRLAPISLFYEEQPAESQSSIREEIAIKHLR